MFFRSCIINQYVWRCFLSELKNPEYANSFIVENSTIIMSISQISETLFILAPVFLRRFGIKQDVNLNVRFGFCVSVYSPTEILQMVYGG
jgi:hypothetical protein